MNRSSSWLISAVIHGALIAGAMIPVWVTYAEVNAAASVGDGRSPFTCQIVESMVRIDKIDRPAEVPWKDRPVLVPPGDVEGGPEYLVGVGGQWPIWGACYGWVEDPPTICGGRCLPAPPEFYCYSIRTLDASMRRVANVENRRQGSNCNFGWLRHYLSGECRYPDVCDQ